MRKFHLSDILTITTGKLVSTRLMDGVYDILGYMTGEGLYTHQLIRAVDICRPELLLQYPQLTEVKKESLKEGPTEQELKEWLDKWIAKFGEELEVATLEEGKYQAKNPLVELEEMVSKDTGIIVVQVEGE